MRSRKALYNIISQMSYEVIAMICGLILPRLILSAFGSSYNGMVSSITQFLDYISVLTLGISGSTRVAIYKAKASGDINKVSSVLRANELYMHKVAYAFIAYLAFMTAAYPFIVRNEFAWFDSASLVIIIGLGVFAEYFFGITYKTFLMANQSMYVYNIIQIGSKILSTLISAGLIMMGQSIQVVKLGSAVCFVAAPILLNYIVRKKYGIRKDAEPDPAALSQRRDVMAHSIANTIHQYTDIFLLTLFTAPAVVSVYAVYNLVLGSLRKLQNVFTTGLEGGFGELWASEEYDKFESNFNTFEFCVFSFVSIVFSCTAVLLIPFISLYTSGITDIEYVLPVYAGLAVVTEAVYCIRMPYLIAVQAAGRYKETKTGAFIEAGLNFGISLIAVLKWGLIGVLAGTLAANTFRTVQYSVYLSRNILNRPSGRFIMKLLWACSNALIIIVIWNTFIRLDISTWKLWIAGGFISAALSSAVVLLSGMIFYRKELAGAKLLVRKMTAKK